MAEPLLAFPEGSTALVTGASRGIGEAIALTLAEQGCDVAVNYRSRASQAERVAEQVEKLGRRALLVKADITSESEVIAMFKAVRSAWKRLDVAVLNSGVTADGHLAAMSHQKWNEVISTNLTGTFFTAREATKQMFGTGGAIVMVSSTSGVAGRPGQGNYAASKGGVIALAKTLAHEVAPRQIRVNVVAPGFIETDMIKTVPPALLAQARQGIPLGRLGTPAEVARAVTFLASPLASYITGKVLTVDGGMING